MQIIVYNLLLSQQQTVRVSAFRRYQFEGHFQKNIKSVYLVTVIQVVISFHIIAILLSYSIGFISVFNEPKEFCERKSNNNVHSFDITIDSYKLIPILYSNFRK